MADRLDAKLTCTEEIVASGGRGQKKMKNAIRPQTGLDTSRARIGSARIADEWEIAISVGRRPSFSVKSNAIRWRVDAITETGQVEVVADFELLVVPEVVRNPPLHPRIAAAPVSTG